MKEKSIRSIVVKKINSWLKSIDDLKVRELCSENTIVTGGCFTSMLLNEPINDFDVYFRDENTTYEVAKYYFNKIDCEKSDSDKILKTETGIKTFIQSKGYLKAKKVKVTVNDSTGDKEIQENQEKELYKPIFITANAITLTDKLQIITRFYGEPEDIHKNFDFIHCTCYYDYGKRDLVLPQKALLSILTKSLYYSGSKYPVCSIFRLRKYIKRGWKVSAGEICKIAYQISLLDLNNVAVLEDQLTGVDTSYFAWFIQKIKEEIADSEDQGNPFNLNYDYVRDLLDKLFN